MGDAAVMAGHPWALLPGFMKWGVVGRERGIGEGGRGRGLAGDIGGSKWERMGENGRRGDGTKWNGTEGGEVGGCRWLGESGMGVTRP